MKVTEHFSVEEFDQKDGKAPYPPAWVRGRLTPLCHVLERIRAELGGRAILITSGYRTQTYNRAIGGARYSQHMEGDAADFKVTGVSADTVHAAVLRLYNEGKIMIGGLGAYPSWTHIDMRQGSRLARWSGTRT